jgi:hypothetical protein
MRISRSIAAAAAFCAVSLTPATASANQAYSNAESIRTLDMMLMATSLRCRNGAYDFRPEYAEFSRFNMHLLNRANDNLRRNLSATYGARGGERELDRMSVRAANRFGNGHPTMDCEALKVVAGDLARAHTEASLLAVADRLLSAPRIAYDF